MSSSQLNHGRGGSDAAVKCLMHTSRRRHKRIAVHMEAGGAYISSWLRPDGSVCFLGHKESPMGGKGRLRGSWHTDVQAVHVCKT